MTFVLKVFDQRIVVGIKAFFDHCLHISDLFLQIGSEEEIVFDGKQRSRFENGEYIHHNDVHDHLHIMPGDIPKLIRSYTPTIGQDLFTHIFYRYHVQI